MQVHPSQISSSQPFDIFYFIRNHTDAATYYVRGVVYDVRTGEVLGTHTLTQSPTNSRLFIKSIQAPADPTGYGRNIVAIASVYTDDTYTTKSENYEEQEQYYLVKDVLPFFGGGGSIDMRAFREIVQEEVQKGVASIPKPPKAPEPQSLDALYGALGALQREVNRIPKETPEQLDLSPLQARVEAISKAIGALPEPDKVDLMPVSEQLSNITAALDEMRTDMAFEIDRMKEQVTARVVQWLETTTAALEQKLITAIEAQEFSFPVQRKVARPEPTAKPAAPDLSFLTS